ncbi:MAG: hypothetical protein ACRDYY_12810 [Acidimicrobiales bacterium]
MIIPGAAISALVAGLIAGWQPVLLLVPALLLIPVILWKRPHYAVLFLLAACTEIEQWSYTVGTHSGTFTDRIPFFRTFTHSMILLPAEIFVLVAVLVWIAKSGIEKSLHLPHSAVMRWLTLLWVLLLVAMGVGMSHGARLNIALWELRPWLFLSVTYLLASAFLRSRKAFDAVLWIFILGSGFKGIQGTYIFFVWTRRMSPRPEEILSHEEAFFFGVYIMITVGLWMWGIKGRMRTTATVLFPFVLISDMANSRRVAWLIVAGSLATMFVIAYLALPHRRKFLRRTLAVFAVCTAVYMPVYWNHTGGTLGQPARAFRSAVDPSPRDKSSDLYRQQEDINLILTIKVSGKLGRGFGIPILYSDPITNISGIDSMIAYIPHDGLLWIWMRMGIQGEIVFWCFISAAIVKAARLSRCADRQLSLLGAVITCSIVAYVLMGHEDMGFAWIRIAGAMGCFLGTLEAATRIAAAELRAVTEVSDDATGLPALLSGVRG